MTLRYRSAAVVSLLLAAPALAAQSRSEISAPEGTVTIALTTTLPDTEAQAVVIRRAQSRRNIVLLKESAASPTTLAAALAVLDHARARDGEDAPRDAYVVLKNPRLRGRLSQRYLERLAERLARLRTAAPTAVEGLEGTLRAISLPLSRRPAS